MSQGMKSNLKNTLLFISLINSSALAAVNTKDASFNKSFIDLGILERSYNSRSLYNGIFGFGWCSEFEKKLDLSVEGQVTFKDCSLPQDVIYKDNISSSGELLRSTKNHYFINDRDHKMVFNKKGELTDLKKKSLRYELTYDESGFLRKITINKKQILRLNYDYSLRKVREILGSQEQALRYVYTEQDLLQVIGRPQESYKYRYDKLHNLKEITHPDKKMEFIRYNESEDRVVSHQDGSGCVENYQYQEKYRSLLTILEKSCPRQPSQLITFEFFEKTRSDGQNYLEKLLITSQALSKEVTYDAFSGAPKKVTFRKALRMAASGGFHE